MLRHDLHLLLSNERPHKGVKASANSDIVYFFTSAQDSDTLQDDVRLCLGNDIKKAKGTKMQSEYQQDYKKTRAYAPKIYNDPNMPDSLRDIYRTSESRYVHKGRTIDPSFYNDLSDDSVAKFTAIGFDCLISLDEQICPRFIFEFYKTLKLERDSNNHFSIQFIINNHHFNLSLTQFSKLTHLPNQGICIYSDAWGLDELKKTLEKTEPYNSYLPALDDIQNLINRRTVHGTDNQEKDEKQSQNDKTGLGMEKTVKDKAKSKPESQSSQKVKVKVNPGAKVKEI
ncbi:hypothetical protein Tco_0680265 [Tanacetum coccineum]|uniref:Uncharacterized protein n=1 Tax=Tanacetum coccineum TaxID=301880 RepID=A0ABQ4XLH7_9ASTR